MDLKELDKIKRLAIIAMFSDDEFLEQLVLKGGNAMDIVYRMEGRASTDLDFSMSKEFREKDLKFIDDKIKNVLEDIFYSEGYKVFDIKFVQRPKHRKVSSKINNFWGGYRIEFKVITKEKYDTFNGNLDDLRKQSIEFTEVQNRKFYIDISKFEYTKPKVEKELDAYTIYVYTPEMIAFEKLRAICQQTKEYGKIVNSKSQSARARDFYDIYLVIEKFNVDVSSNENKMLLKTIFKAKHVPLELIKKIRDYKEYHRPDFQAVKETVKYGTELKEYDYYFDYVLDKFSQLEFLGEI